MPIINELIIRWPLSGGAAARRRWAWPVPRLGPLVHWLGPALAGSGHLLPGCAWRLLRDVSGSCSYGTGAAGSMPRGFLLNLLGMHPTCAPTSQVNHLFPALGDGSGGSWPRSSPSSGLLILQGTVFFESHGSGGGGGSEGSGSVRLPTLALRHLARLYILPFKDIALAALRMSLGPHAAA